jgi:hypothetical protein
MSERNLAFTRQPAAHIQQILPKTHPSQPQPLLAFCFIYGHDTPRAPGEREKRSYLN